MIKFDAKTQIVVSDDLREDVIQLVNDESGKHILLVIDDAVIKNKEAEDLITALAKTATLEKDIIQSYEPTTDLVNEKTRLFRGENIDLIIGIGGGSVMDLAKALSVMIVHDGDVEDYHGTGKTFTRGIKKILIPTTAGTGSEVTPGAVLVNKKTNFKRGISGRFVSADYAVLNPKLTVSMPDSVTASTGLDALAHAIESYTAKGANDITKMYSAKAFALIYNNLEKVFDEPQNLEVRKSILLGSCLAGFAIYNSNTGACHALSYPLGIYHQVPHGIAVARLLTKIVELNINKGCHLYGDLYDLIKNKENESSEKIFNAIKKSEKFIGLLSRHPVFSYLNKNFSDYGITIKELDFLAERGLDLAPALNNNPVDFTLQDAKVALTAAL